MRVLSDQTSTVLAADQLSVPVFTLKRYLTREYIPWGSRKGSVVTVSGEHVRPRHSPLPSLGTASPFSLGLDYPM